jgi:hypothetical protein
MPPKLDSVLIGMMRNVGKCCETTFVQVTGHFCRSSVGSPEAAEQVQTQYRPPRFTPPDLEKRSKPSLAWGNVGQR